MAVEQDLITLTRVRNLIYLDKFPDDILEILTYKESIILYGRELQIWIARQTQAGSLRPTNRKTETRVLYRKVADGGLVCLAGLTARICNFLRQRGIPFRLDDRRDVLVPAPDYRRVGPLRGNQADVLVALASHDHGLIDVTAAGGKTHLFGEIASMWPTVPILIIAPRDSIIKTVIGYLKERGIDCGICTGYKVDLKRVTVCSSQSLHKIGSLLQDVRIVLYDEVYTAGASRVSKLLAEIQNARMFGFADGPFTRSDGRNAVVEALFGPVICHVSYTDALDKGMVSDLHVLMIPVSGQGYSGIKSRHRADINKRNWYWNNPGRNLAVAQAVQIGSEYVGLPADECQTLILCENTEHVLRLKQLLPEFQVCHAGRISVKRKEQFVRMGFQEEGVDLTSRMVDNHRIAFESGDLKKVIATPIWSAGVNFESLRVEIRADGRVSQIDNIQYPGRLCRLHPEKEFGLLIDFVDSFDTGSLRRSDARMRQYRKKGWPVETYPQQLPLPP